MSSKKVATAVDILVNVDRYEHIKITKYCEKVIEYSTEEERIQKEDQLTLECVSDLIRGQDIIAKTIGGKVVKPCEEMKEKISKKLPTWMVEGPEPNIANSALDNHEESVSKNYVASEEIKIEEAEMSSDIDSLVGDITDITADEKTQEIAKPEPVVKEEPKQADKEVLSDDDLFGNDDDLFA